MTEATTEAEALVRDVLYASGSSLDFFSLHKTRQAMFDAAQKHIDSASTRGFDEAMKQANNIMRQVPNV